MGMLFAPPIAALISVVITGNIELKENHMKYVMELNKAREKNRQEQEEQLGIIDKNTMPIPKESKTEEKETVVKTEETNEEKKEEVKEPKTKKVEKKTSSKKEPSTKPKKTEKKTEKKEVEVK